MEKNFIFDHSKKIEEIKHLSNEIKPIVTCIGDFDDFNYKAGEIFQRFDGRFKNTENVSYSEDEKYFLKHGMKNQGDNTYVISKIDSNNKYSEGFFDCTSVIVVGTSLSNGENISFLTHQYPGAILYDYKEEFLKDLVDKLEEIKNQSKEKTVDAIILGGNNFLDKNKNNKYVISTEENYEESIKLLSQEIKDKLGFKPTVINGPKEVEGFDNIYFDNKNRRVYFIRPKLNKVTS